MAIRRVKIDDGAHSRRELRQGGKAVGKTQICWKCDEPTQYGQVIVGEFYCFSCVKRIENETHVDREKKQREDREIYEVSKNDISDRVW